MRHLLFYFPIFLLFSCSTTNYYVVRHAEKVTAANSMVSDVPLSEAGEKRAIALKDALKRDGIQHIFSTNYLRTKSTAAPLGEYIGVGTEVYDPKDTTFVAQLKNIKENTLVVGHSNTVDDIVNGLTGQKLLQDLPDTEYGDLFIVKRRGHKWRLIKSHFGQ